MKIWRTGSARDSGLMQAEGEWSPEFSEIFDEPNHLVCWNKPKIVVPRGEPRKKNVRDAPYFPHHPLLLLSAYGVDALFDLIKDDVELLPVDCDLGEYWVLHVMTVLDCIDLEHSAYTTYPSTGNLMDISEYWLKDDVMEGHNIFMAKEPLGSRYFETAWPFVSDEYVKRVEERGITGYRFTLVWDSDLGHTIELPFFH